jgi:hypothetical protein
MTSATLRRTVTRLVTVCAMAAWSASLAAQDRDRMKPLQHAVASSTARFGSVGKDDPTYRAALEAHDLTAAQALVGKQGSFRGTVSKLFEERDGDLVVLDFDPNYRSALTAVLRNVSFPKFPDMKALEGKEVVVSGTFSDYRGKAQVELADPSQIKLVE